MATKKSTKKAAPRRRKSGVTQIPGAGATLGLAIANIAPLQTALNNPMDVNNIAGAVRQAVQPKQLAADGIGIVGGYMAGELIKRVAPRFIKTPLGKLAAKMPKVI